MCYSAMVQQNAKKFGRMFSAKVQTDYYDHLFTERLNGKKLYINKGLEETFLLKPETEKDKAIANKISKWHELEVTRIESEMFKQKTRLNDAERVLNSGKITKKAENDQRIATDKIEKFKKDLERHKTHKLSESDSRIYPMHYVSMLTADEKGEKIIMPVRYHMRPHDKDESFDREYYGCYNARLDNLMRVAFWKNSFGRRHGVLLVQKFYENVDPSEFSKKNKLPKEFKDEKNLVLCFEPDGIEYMYVPMLWDKWQKGTEVLYSGAIITDEPLPEIADAGHDRTPIFLTEAAVEAWINPKGRSNEELKEILQDREHPHYSHRIISAA